MYLTGPEIARLVELCTLTIDPFNPECVGPNSIDVHLAPELRCYLLREGQPLDLKTISKAVTTTHTIPETGYVLRPGVLYLGRTVEYTEFPHHVSQITGRSSIGRAGIQVHVTAGLGDIGFKGTWTLEITAVHPIRVYPHTRIAQLFVAEARGDVLPYKGRYLGQREITPSRFDL
jgi:dCTP deaminase